MKVFPRNRLKSNRLGFSFVIVCFFVYYSGLLTQLFEESFDKNFRYPFEGDISDQCFLIRHNLQPEVSPINNQTFSLRHNNERKCFGDIFLTIVVKSTIDHFARRDAIRNSWGVDGVIDGVEIRTVFNLGIYKNTHNERESLNQKLVDIEAEKFNDIIQVSLMDFHK